MGSSRSEAGFALIEAIVSAAVLAIVALAVLSGIDGANGASAREKSRAVAASLAEQDQERLRAMTLDQAAAPTQQPPVKVDGVTYTIKTSSEWVTDDVGGTPACGVDGNQVQYLHVTSTVSSAVVGTRIPAVTVDSLISPTAKAAESRGTLGVRVTDRVKKGVQGIAVTASSPAYTAPTKATDQDGCVVFDALPVGNYTVTLNTPGYIGRDGKQLVTKVQSVAAKKVTFVALTYDRATKAQVTITTHRPNSVWSAADAKPSKARTVSTTNGASVGLLLPFTPASGPSSSIEATGLFPFAENSYQFFTGGCSYSSPDTYKPANTNYFTEINSAAALLSDPANLNQAVTVRQPPVNIRIAGAQGTNGAFTDGAVTVYMKLQKPADSTDSCSEPIYTLTTMNWPTPDQGWGTAPGNLGTHWVSQSGSFDPGLPFGTYKICLRQNNVSWSWTGTYDNTAVDGMPNGVTQITAPSKANQWKASGTTCGL